MSEQNTNGVTPNYEYIGFIPTTIPFFAVKSIYFHNVQFYDTDTFLFLLKRGNIIGFPNKE